MQDLLAFRPIAQ